MRALVLSGGGARGAFEVGVIRGLIEDRNLDFDLISGISAGALNGAFLSQAPRTPNSLAGLKTYSEKLANFWLSLKGNSDIYTERPGGFAGFALGADSLYDYSPLLELLKKQIDVTLLRNSHRNFFCGAVDLVTGQYRQFRPSDKDIFNGILASASIPVIFPFVRLGPSVLVDGGVRRISALGPVFNENPPPDEIFLVLSSRLKPEDKPARGELPTNGVVPNSPATWEDQDTFHVNGFKVLARTVDILTDEIYLKDVREALLWNKAIEALSAAQPALPASASQHAATVLSKKVKSKINVIAPQFWWEPNPTDTSPREHSNDSSQFDPDLIKFFIKHGREIAGHEDQWLIYNND
jgi:NTE family protein